MAEVRSSGSVVGSVFVPWTGVLVVVVDADVVDVLVVIEGTKGDCVGLVGETIKRKEH